MLPNNHRWVFTFTGETPLNNTDMHKTILDEATGTSGWVLHDLRRTARTLMSRAGVNSEIAEPCLGHVTGGVRGYTTATLTLKKSAMRWRSCHRLLGRS